MQNGASMKVSRLISELEKLGIPDAEVFVDYEDSTEPVVTVDDDGSVWID